MARAHPLTYTVLAWRVEKSLPTARRAPFMDDHRLPLLRANLEQFPPQWGKQQTSRWRPPTWRKRAGSTTTGLARRDKATLPVKYFSSPRRLPHHRLPPSRCVRTEHWLSQSPLYTSAVHLHAARASSRPPAGCTAHLPEQTISSRIINFKNPPQTNARRHRTCTPKSSCNFRHATAPPHTSNHARQSHDANPRHARSRFSLRCAPRRAQGQYPDKSAGQLLHVQGLVYMLCAQVPTSLLPLGDNAIVLVDSGLPQWPGARRHPARFRKSPSSSSSTPRATPNAPSRPIDLAQKPAISFPT